MDDRREILPQWNFRQILYKTEGSIYYGFFSFVIMSHFFLKFLNTVFMIVVSDTSSQSNLLLHVTHFMPVRYFDSP